MRVRWAGEGMWVGGWVYLGCAAEYDSMAAVRWSVWVGGGRGRERSGVGRGRGRGWDRNGEAGGATEGGVQQRPRARDRARDSARWGLGRVGSICGEGQPCTGNVPFALAHYRRCLMVYE